MQIKSMCIFDLDGTLNLTDKKLSVEIYKMSKTGVCFVTATGRTNSYVKETCRKHNIIPPRFIIADNGGTIYDNAKQEYIKRTTLPVETRRKILEEYIRLGGLPEYIRYTDGDYVYATTEQDVKKYYEKEDSIKHMEAEELFQSVEEEESDVTKVTLAGNKKIMRDMEHFIKRSGIRCWTDIGSTKFPHRVRENYRLDIMDGETCKGEAVEFLLNYTGIGNFTCIGNGPNDFSMFKYALDSDMPVIVVKNFEAGKISKESEELIAQVEEYAKSIGKTDKVTIAPFPINGYIGRMEDKRLGREKRIKFVEGLKIDTVPKIDNIKKGNQARIPRTQHRGER